MASCARVPDVWRPRWSTMLRGVDALAPAGLHEDPDRQVRARLLVIFPAILLLVAPIFVVSYWITNEIASGLLVIAAAIAAAAAPAVLRATGSIPAASHWLAAVVAGVLFALGYRDNVDQTTVSWFVAVPVMVAFLAGQRAGLVWFAVVVVQLVALFGLEIAGRIPVNAAVAETPLWLHFIAHVTLMGCIMAFALAQERLRHGAMVALAASNEKLAATTEAAERASRAKSEFLANMSHEIRTPMNGVIGMAELLKSGTLGQEERRFAEVIASSGEALLTIINDILDFSKIEAGKLALESIDFDLHGCVEGVVDVLGGRAREKGLALSATIDPAVERHVRGDPGRLRQILLNLTSNAIKFTAEGRVELQVAPWRRPGRSTGPAICVRVRDTGIGIPADRLPDLFQSFTQLDTSTTRRFGGTGLGLAISWTLAQAMGGTIEVASEPGQGSTFRVFVELGQATGADARPADREVDDAHPSRDAQILVVEDDSVNQLVARQILARIGHRCDMAGNGREALEALAVKDYDLVLMDCHMPELDGYETTREIRRREHGARRTRVVAMTASATVDDRRRCLEAGMDEHITKPVTIAGLRSLLQACQL